MDWNCEGCKHDLEELIQYQEQGFNIVLLREWDETRHINWIVIDDYGNTICS